MCKKIFILLICICSATNSLYSQNANDSAKGIIYGTIEDTVHKQSMEQALIQLLPYGDTSKVLQNTMADANGKYLLKNIATDSFYLKISFAGYATILQKVVIDSQHPITGIAPIYMRPKTEDLDEVIIQSTVQPIKLNGDTTEFKADAFHTKPNATVEDLLKKLPGIDVDATGNIKAQGETVTRIYVNGKRFFGDNPKMATQNLPPDVVDKIQVFDALSDQSTFSGFDDGNRVKTINIITKKDKNHGYFGKVSASKGTSNVYSGNASVNRFDGEQQISFVGQINNSNQQMVTGQHLPNTANDHADSAGITLNGITKTWTAGLNYRNNWGKNTQAYGSYSFNKTDNSSGQYAERINLYSDSSRNTNQNSQHISGSNNSTHKFQFNIESKIDSMNSLIFRPNISAQSTDNYNSGETHIFKINNGATQPISNTVSNGDSHNDGYNASGDLLLRHRFLTKGRTFSLGLNWSGNNNNGNGHNNNTIIYGERDSTVRTQRYYVTSGNGHSYNATASYTEPIGLKQQIELNFNHSYNSNQSNRTTYNWDSITQQYSVPDSLLTNHYQNEYQSDRGTLSYHYNDGTLTFSAGGGIQFGHRHSVNLSKNIDLTQNFTNFYPTANFRYNIDKSRNIRFNYEGRTSQPSVSQLQPVVDNTNPLYIRDGNPQLKQTFSNSFRLQYFSFNRVTNINMFATINFSFINNNIVNAISSLSNGGQYVKPINMNGNYTLNAYYNYGFPIKAIASNLNFSTNIGTSRTGSMIDTVTNFTNNYSFGETIKWTTNLDKNFDVNFFATPNYHITKYSVQGRANANYFSQVLDLEFTYYTKAGWILNTKFDYTYYNGLYTTSTPLWNMAVSRQIFKNKRGEIKLTVHDLLNQNQSVSNSRSDNYIQQTTNTVLRRYAMLSFIYNIRNFARYKASDVFKGQHGKNGDPDRSL